MLIIHETDPHGCGIVYYEGSEIGYSYDDEMGNLRGAIDFLISIGFVDPNTVAIFDDNNSIYEKLDGFLKNIS